MLKGIGLLPLSGFYSVFLINGEQKSTPLKELTSARRGRTLPKGTESHDGCLSRPQAKRYLSLDRIAGVQLSVFHRDPFDGLLFSLEGLILFPVTSKHSFDIALKQSYIGILHRSRRLVRKHTLEIGVF